MADEAFRAQIRKASARYRLERLSRASRAVAWAVAGTLLLLLLLSLVTPVVAWAGPVGIAVCLIGLVSALVIFYRAIERHHLLVRMDMHGKLPDSVLSSGDWETVADGNPWCERQRAETLRQLEKIDWRQAWPVRWPRFLWVPLTGSLVLLVALSLVQRNWQEKERLNNLAAAQENAPVQKEQLKPLEDVFKDWDAAQQIAPSPEMEQMLKDLKPLRDQMASGKMTEKELFLKLNEIQARLQAQKDQLEASSLEPMAQSLADAVKDLDGMSGLSSALQRKDFAAAKEQAAQAEQKYNSGAAKMPEGANAQTAAGKLSEAAQKASGDKQASSSISQMQAGISKKDSSSMSKGLNGLKNSLGQESQRQSQCHNLGMQLAQLGMCKNGMCKNPGQGAGIKMGLPTLSLAKSLSQQKGAGTSSDPNLTGAQTQIDAGHQEMKITGTAGEGASETQTESTNDSHNEQTASSVTASQFRQYEKLSEQATEDENLPVADRQMIKRYFEDIRPQASP